MTELFNVLHLPPSLLAAMRFRTAPGSDLRPGPAFNGADLRLVLVIWAAYAQKVGDQKFVTELSIPQRVITHHIGRVHRERLVKSITRIGNTEVWDGEGWHRLLQSIHTTPGVPTHPKVAVGDTWNFGLTEGFAKVLWKQFLGLKRWASFQIDSADLQQLESRYSVTLLCRYRAWMSGNADPEGVTSFGKLPSGKAISIELPTNDIAPVIFGHHEPIPISVMKRLFWTEGPVGTVAAEMRRVKVDLRLMPLMSAIRGEIGMEIAIGEIERTVRKPKTMAEFNADMDMGKISHARKKIVHRKRGVKSNDLSNAT